MAKLKDLLNEVFEDAPKVNKHKVTEVAESAHSHILGEQDDWFDKVSVNRNMKSLKGNVMEFQKTAKEAHSVNQRLTALYEDIGHVLNRYYDII